MEKRAKSSKHSHFWRACRYLLPYRIYIAISIVCAFFVGLTLASGLGALLPLLRVLINGDSLQGWAYRQTAEMRLGVHFQQDPGIVQIVQITNKSGGAAGAGLKPGVVIEGADLPPDAPPSPFPGRDSDPAYKAGEILRRIARGVRGRLISLLGENPSRCGSRRRGGLDWRRWG